jgi:hypothetical protein
MLLVPHVLMAQTLRPGQIDTNLFDDLMQLYRSWIVYIDFNDITYERNKKTVKEMQAFVQSRFSKEGQALFAQYQKDLEFEKSDEQIGRYRTLNGQKIPIEFEADFIVKSRLYLSFENLLLEALEKNPDSDMLVLYKKVLEVSDDDKIKFLVQKILQEHTRIQKEENQKKDHKKELTALLKDMGYELLEIKKYYINRSTHIDMLIVEKDNRKTVILDLFYLLKEHIFIQKQQDIEVLRDTLKEQAFQYASIWEQLEDFVRDKEAYDFFTLSYDEEKKAKEFSDDCHKLINGLELSSNEVLEKIKPYLSDNKRYNRYLRIRYNVIEPIPYEQCNDQSKEWEDYQKEQFYLPDGKKCIGGGFGLKTVTDTGGKSIRYCQSYTPYTKIITNKEWNNLCKLGIFEYPNFPCNTIRGLKQNTKEPFTQKSSSQLMSEYHNMCLDNNGNITDYNYNCTYKNTSGVIERYSQIIDKRFVHVKDHIKAKNILQNVLNIEKDLGNLEKIIEINLMLGNINDAYNFLQMSYNNIKTALQYGYFKKSVSFKEEFAMSPQEREDLMNNRKINALDSSYGYRGMLNFLDSSLMIYRYALKNGHKRIAQEIYHKILGLKTQSKNEPFVYNFHAYITAALFQFQYISKGHADAPVKGLDKEIENRIKSFLTYQKCNDASGRLFIIALESNNDNLIEYIHKKMDFTQSYSYRYGFDDNVCSRAKKLIEMDTRLLFEDI